ncbi:MAG: response regulator transcription factor [Mucilaginibacter sp.]
MNQFNVVQNKTAHLLLEEKVFKNSPERVRPLVHIIDDCFDIRLLLKREFKDNYLFVESKNGLAGFKKAVSTLPDIIICDVKMPGINGIRLCELLKEDRRTCLIPILLLTGNSTDECLLNGLKSGADCYVTKPFNFAILKARIDNLIKSRKLLTGLLTESEPLHAQTALNPIDEPFLKKVYGAIEQNIGNSAFDANDFAKAIGMSRAQIYRRIKVVTGYSVKEFIRITRLQKATTLILSGKQNISEIAYEVGFSSVPYFSSSFSRHFKVSPSKYILLNKSE